MSDIRFSESLVLHYSGSERCSPGHSCGGMRLHYLLHFIVSGRGIFRSGEKSCRLSAGNAFLIRPYEYSYYRADDKEPWEYIWIAFNGAEAPRLLRDIGLESERVLKTDKMGEISEKLRILLKSANENNRYRSLEQFYGIAALLYKPYETGSESSAEQYVRKAADYIENNYAYPIRIDSISEKLGIDRSYLYRIFTERMSVSPKEYLNSVRIRAAKEMLAAGKYSVTQTAFSCGFSDASAFCNGFRRAVGMTAGEYRAKYAETILLQ